MNTRYLLLGALLVLASAGCTHPEPGRVPKTCRTVVDVRCRGDEVATSTEAHCAYRLHGEKLFWTFSVLGGECRLLGASPREGDYPTEIEDIDFASEPLTGQGSTCTCVKGRYTVEEGSVVHKKSPQ